MRERPILFSEPMVQALFAGTKTQTRRILKTQPLDVLPMKGKKRGVEWVGLMQRDPARGLVFRCRLGQPGDRLWVRETWMKTLGGIAYRANGVEHYGAGGKLKWKPSIHMPRWASRITLEVVAVRVERLQEISGADAIAEGIESLGGRGKFWRDYSDPGGPEEVTMNLVDPIVSYMTLWESINGVGSWNDNPWVWVVEFSRRAGSE